MTTGDYWIVEAIAGMIQDTIGNAYRKGDYWYFTTKKERKKAHPYSILQVPTKQLAKMSVDLKFVELTADVLDIFFTK